MKAPSFSETPEQKQARLKAKSDNLRAIQGDLNNQTNMFRRLMSPRVSIATGRRG